MSNELREAATLVLDALDQWGTVEGSRIERLRKALAAQSVTASHQLASPAEPAPMTELERFEDAIRILCVSDTPPNFESVFGKYKEHYLNFWWTLWQAAKADQAAEIERLRKELKYQDAREGWIGTHADGCWSWGTSHYECALGQIAKLKDGNA